jgi:putative tricarboxylic transport membrane protein
VNTFELLGQGLIAALQVQNLIYALIGVTLGTAVGVLPGIGPALTVALLLPVTYNLDPAGSLIMFAGIYYGGMYGGSTTSILLNTPGESASIVTALEGNKMARQGRGGPALATAAIGSFVAGLIATLGLAFIAPFVVKFALSFGPADYFALMILAFVTVSAAFGDSPLRGLTALFIGLGLGIIGIDQQTGQTRLAFGVLDLLDGIEVTTLAVALFAIGETLKTAADREQVQASVMAVKGSVWMTLEDWKRSWASWLRGTFIGFPIGAMPAGGADIASFLSYSAEKSFAKKPEEFGHGAIEGVAGPEAANNASAAGTLVPLLTLGLPTTATAAIMLAGFQQFGLQPGPLLFANNASLVWSLIASLLIANFMLLVLNLPLIGLWVKLLTIPKPWLYAGILTFATLGTLGANGAMSMGFGSVRISFELVLLLVFGVLGYLLRRFGYPIAPVVVGLILGPMAEQQLRRALSISQGDPAVLFHSPISLVLYAVAIVAVGLPIIMRMRGKGAVLGQLASDED